jgi:regulator of protease activity HflC (stomatin/prohibitin superfamily)
MKIVEFIRNQGAKAILPVAAALTLVIGLVSGGFGAVEVQPGEAAVVYSTLTGGERVVTDQGTLTFLPFFQRVVRVIVEPQVLTMDLDDENQANPNRDVKLTVRAKDGSEFWFDELEIHFQLVPSMVNIVLAKHGEGDGYKEAVRVHAREVLRNEFGRYTFLEVADPSSYQTATAQATQKLNERLNSTGIQVTLIKTPRPRFDASVETAINDRQTAQQEVRVQERERDRLVKQRDRLVQNVRQTKNAEFQSDKARLEAEFKSAQAQLIEAKTAADTYAIQRRAAADAEKSEKLAQAEGIRVGATERAKGLRAEIEAVGAAGPGMLDRVIAEHVMPQIANIEAVPYARASQPLDIRHIQAPPEDAR